MKKVAKPTTITTQVKQNLYLLIISMSMGFNLFKLIINQQRFNQPDLANKINDSNSNNNFIFRDIDQVYKIEMKKKLFQKVVKPINFNFPFLKNNKMKQCSAYCYKGYEPHYQLYEKSAKTILKHDSKIYCYDNIAVSAALQMSYRQVKTLTVISDTHYETISIEPVQNCLNQIQANITKTQFQQHFQTLRSQKLIKKQIISRKESQIALFLMKNYRFVIKKSILDVHPLDSYKKLCGYLMFERKPYILERLSQIAFCNNIMKDNIMTVPLLKEMRQKFLHTQSLKLQTLARRENVVMTDELRNHYINLWKQNVDFNLISTGTSSFEEKTILNWSIQNNIGNITLLQEVLKNKYRHHHFATWI